MSKHNFKIVEVATGANNVWLFTEYRCEKCGASAMSGPAIKSAKLDEECPVLSLWDKIKLLFKFN